MASRTLICIALAAASISTAPAGAISPFFYAVDRFYEARANSPVWLRDRTAVAQLVDVLRSADLDGFGKGPQLADRVAAAAHRASSGDPAAIRAAERLLSSVWIEYVQAISWPAPGILVGDQALARRIPQAPEILQQAAEAASLDQHVRHVASANPIHERLRQAARQARLSGDRALEKRILANLGRARALPASGRYVLVDLASARLWMYEDGQARDSMRVIVGKTDQQTPLIASTVRHATLNPYWHVPIDMVRRTIAQGVLREGLGYLQARGYEVVSDYNQNAVLLAPEAINWKAVAEGHAEARVRQRPGGANAMGELKIMFSNSAGIYLHDTPDKALFENERRALSGGCIRLEDARRLARWLLGHDPVAESAEPEQRVELPTPVPIYVTYLTVQPFGNELAFTDDLYGLDENAEPAAAS